MIFSINKNLCATLLLLALLTACNSASDTSDHTRLAIDFNGTTRDPLIAYSISDMSHYFREAWDDKGNVYTFDTNDWERGIYYIRIDANNGMYVVVDNDREILINARLNALDESTTNSSETQLLWNVQQLQKTINAEGDTIVARNQPLDNIANRKKAASQINAMLSLKRAEADKLLSKIGNSVVAIEIFALGYGNSYLYSIVDDYEIMANYALALANSYPNNLAVKGFSESIQKAYADVQLAKRYAVGNKFPRVDIITQEQQNYASTDELTGSRFAFFYTNDTTPAMQNYWLRVASHRYDGYKIFAALPPQIEQRIRFNVIAGRLHNSSDTVLNRLQPLIIVCDENAKILKTYIRATAEDADCVW